MCFFDKSNNSTIVNTLKQLLNKREREKTFHRYPVNECIPKGYALQ